MATWAERFEKILDKYRREYGSRWSGAALERATGGKVTGAYVSHVRQGHNKDPSFDRIDAISRAMGVPLEEWRDEEDINERES